MAQIQIKSGDTLGELALQFDTSIDELLNLNVDNPSVRSADLIIAGGSLNIPEPVAPPAAPITQSPTETTPPPQGEFDTDSFLKELQDRFLGDTDVISSEQTELETELEGAREDILAGGEASRKRIESIFGRRVEERAETGEQRLTETLELSRGLGPASRQALIRRIDVETKKDIAELEDREQEALLKGDEQEAKALANLRLETIKFRVNAKNQMLSDVLEVGRFGISLAKEQRAQIESQLEGLAKNEKISAIVGGLRSGNIFVDDIPASIKDDVLAEAQRQGIRLTERPPQRAGGNISISDINNLGLPLTTFGLPEQQVIQDITSNTPPPWFISDVQSKTQTSLVPSELQRRWSLKQQEFANVGNKQAEFDFARSIVRTNVEQIKQNPTPENIAALFSALRSQTDLAVGDAQSIMREFGFTLSFGNWMFTGQ